MTIERHLPSTSRRQTCLALVLVAVVTLITFAPALQGDFLLWDDPPNVTANPLLKERVLPALIFFWCQPHQPYAGLYVPVTYTAWLAEARLSWLLTQSEVGAPLSPAVFHAANLLWQVVAAWAVYSLVRTLLANGRAALLAAVAFAVHPLHVESVAWITEAKGLLAGALGLWAAALYLNWSSQVVMGRPQPPSWPRRLQAWAALLLFVLALLSKPSVVPLPAVVLVLDVVFIGRRPLASLRSLALWWVAAAGCLLITRAAQSQLAGELPPLNLLQRLQVALDALAFYLEKLVWPAGLIPDYGRTPAVALAEPIWPAILVVGSAFLVAAALPGRRIWLTAFALIVLGLAPNLGLVSFAYQRFSTPADRYAYLALLGPALAIGYLASRFRHPAAIALLTALLAAWSALSFQQSRLWRDDRALFTYTLALNPRSHVSANVLGIDARRRGDLQQAQACFEIAIQIAPELEGGYFNLADLYERQGRTAEAIQLYLQALERRPGYAKAQARLDVLLGSPPGR